MGVRLPSVQSSAILASVPASGAETVLFTTPPINLILDGAQVLLFWEVVQAIGAGTTSYAVRLRRGTTTAGVLINISVFLNTTAATNVRASGNYPDLPGIAAEVQYSLTAAGTATTGAFTTLDGSLLALVL